MADLHISGDLSVPERELELHFARSGGPGGQKVNTSSTKVELRFDLEASTALTEHQKARVREQLRGRLTSDGVLVLQASEHRTQGQNRRAVVGRFRTLLRQALAVPPPRHATRPTRASRERRLEDKRHQAEKKRFRRAPDD